MATQVLTDVKTFLDRYDLSGDMNACALTYEAELNDDTVFGDDTRSNKGGLTVVRAEHEGLWEGGTDLVDDALFSRIGLAEAPLTIAPIGGSRGDPAYFFRAVEAAYSPEGEVGGMLEFSVSAEGGDGQRLVDGVVEHANAQETGSGTSSGVNLGSVGSEESVYAVLHVFANGGDGSQTLDVDIESDDGSGFPSPVTQISFSQVTTTNTAEIASAAGSISDTWWRVNWTIGGTGSPSFTFVVAIGIE